MEEKIMTKEDLEAGKNGGRIQTRFPPEPNGYIHIGHAKAICMDFGVAEKFGGICNLRFDDTNPTKENTEYVENIMSDIKWLGFHWENIYYASDYFEKLWDFAIWLINTSRPQSRLPSRRVRPHSLAVPVPSATVPLRRTCACSIR